MAENNDRGENSEKKGERSKIGLIKVRTNLFATPPPPRHDIEDPSADVHADEAIASQEPQLESDIFGSYIDGSFGAVEEPDSGASSTSNMAVPSSSNMSPLPSSIFGQPSCSSFVPPSDSNFGPPSFSNFGPPSSSNFGPPSSFNFGPPSSSNFGPQLLPHFRMRPTSYVTHTGSHIKLHSGTNDSFHHNFRGFPFPIIVQEPVPVRQVPSCPTPEINVLVVSSSRYTSIGTRRANHMAFHPSTNEFAVVFPESLKFFRIDSPKDKTVVKRVTSIPALPDALFKQVRLGPTGSDTLALTGSQLLRVGGGEIKPIFGNTMEVFNLFASDFVTYAAVGTMFGDVYVVELETGRLEFSVDVSDFQIRTIQLIGNFLFVVADNLMSVIDLTSETVHVVIESQQSELRCGVTIGKFMAVGTENGQIVLHTMPHMSILEVATVNPGMPVTTMASFMDSYIIAGFQDGFIRIFSVFPIREVDSLERIVAPVLRLEVSFDNAWLLSNDYESCKLHKLPRLPKRELVPHGTGANSPESRPTVPMPFGWTEFVAIKQEPAEPPADGDESYW